MNKHHVVTYQIEAMQRSWLQNQGQDRLYRLYIGCLTGLCAGAILGLSFEFLGVALGGMLLAYAFVGYILGLTGGVILGLIGGAPGVKVERVAWLSNNTRREVQSWEMSGLRMSNKWKVFVSDNIAMVDRLNWSWAEAWHGLIIGLSLGPSLGLMGALVFWMTEGELSDWAMLALGLAIIGVLVGGLIGGLTGGLTSKQIEETTYPNQRFKQTVLSGVISMVIVGLSVGLSTGIVFWLEVAWFSGLFFGMSFGLMGGLVGGLKGGFLALVQNYALREVLVKHDLLPRQLTTFLEYAVSLIFLRRVGGSYIFVHRLLMEHFAEMEIQSDSSGA
jgi:hypothetical protein